MYDPPDIPVITKQYNAKRPNKSIKGTNRELKKSLGLTRPKYANGKNQAYFNREPVVVPIKNGNWDIILPITAIKYSSEEAFITFAI